MRLNNYYVYLFLSAKIRSLIVFSEYLIMIVRWPTLIKRLRESTLDLYQNTEYDALSIHVSLYG